MVYSAGSDNTVQLEYYDHAYLDNAQLHTSEVYENHQHIFTSVTHWGSIQHEQCYTSGEGVEQEPCLIYAYEITRQSLPVLLLANSYTPCFQLPFALASNPYNETEPCNQLCLKCRYQCKPLLQINIQEKCMQLATATYFVSGQAMTWITTLLSQLRSFMWIFIHKCIYMYTYLNKCSQPFVIVEFTI